MSEEADAVAQLTIHHVRRSDGLFVDDVPESVRSKVEVIESVGADPDANAIDIDTVNGRGRRTVVDAGVYRFAGMTTDGRFLLEFEYSDLDGGADIDALDALVQSLYVDGEQAAATGLGCVVDVTFVEDLSIPDGTTTSPASTFTKRWRVQNTGTCPWTDRYAWAFTGGDPLTIESISTIELVEPGDTYDVAVTLRSPAESGAYAGQFQLAEPGTLTPIGPALYFVIQVEPR